MVTSRWPCGVAGSRSCSRGVVSASRLSFHQGAHVLAARQAVLARAMAEEQPEHLALAQETAELRRRHVDQEAGEDPDLDGRETTPGEVVHGRVERRAETPSSMARWMKRSSRRTTSTTRRVEERLVEDGLDQRRTAKAVDQPDVVGHQHGLADDQRRGGGEHEARQLEPVVVDQQVGGEDDEVEREQEEQRGRQHVLEGVKDAAADPPRNGRRVHIRPPSTTKFCAVTSRLSSAASHSTMRAMSGG